MAEPFAEPPTGLAPDMDIGLMLYDVFDLSLAGTSESSPSISLFHAQIRNGVMQVPEYEIDRVLKRRGVG